MMKSFRMVCAKTRPEASMAITFDVVQVLADQLSVKDKARLAAHINEQLAQDVAAEDAAPSAPTTGTDAWERLIVFRRDIAALEGDAPDFGAQLDADRRTRAEALQGTSITVG
jgi:hypothetical protein